MYRPSFMVGTCGTNVFHEVMMCLARRAGDVAPYQGGRTLGWAWCVVGADVSAARVPVVFPWAWERDPPRSGGRNKLRPFRWMLHVGGRGGVTFGDFAVAGRRRFW